jgi:hypothetical protein
MDIPRPTDGSLEIRAVDTNVLEGIAIFFDGLIVHSTLEEKTRVLVPNAVTRVSVVFGGADGGISAIVAVRPAGQERLGRQEGAQHDYTIT